MFERPSVTGKSVPPWKNPAFQHEDVDPLAGFANIMDVMLVFALGLMLALITQSKELREYFAVENGMEVQQGKELLEVPESLTNAMKEGGEGGMESVGKVYRDPKTGKLILIGQ